MMKKVYVVGVAGLLGVGISWLLRKRESVRVSVSLFLLLPLLWTCLHGNFWLSRPEGLDAQKHLKKIKEGLDRGRGLLFQPLLREYPIPPKTPGPCPMGRCIRCKSRGKTAQSNNRWIQHMLIANVQCPFCGPCHCKEISNECYKISENCILHRYMID